MLEYYYSKILKKLRGNAIVNSEIHKTSKVESGSSIVDVHIGKHSFCGYNCEIHYCKIGNYTSIANNVIIGGGMHPISWVGMSPVFYLGRDSVKAKFSTFRRESVIQTKVGNDVWIGHSVLVKQGVTIGDGAVVGMGSIVTKDVQPYSIVAGNPAKEIRKRFSDVIVKDLLDIQWWDMEDSELMKYAKYVRDPKLFIKEIKENHGS